MLFAILFLLPALTLASMSGQVMPMRQCAACICEAISECSVSLTKYNTPCSGTGRWAACGPFLITRPYWVHAGSPTMNDQIPRDPLAFDNCVQDVYCAAKTVINFMKNATFDCNQDGRIDCDDYVLLHKYGSGDCRQDLNKIGSFGTRYLRCKNLMKGLGPNEEQPNYPGMDLILG